MNIRIKLISILTLITLQVFLSACDQTAETPVERSPGGVAPGIITSPTDSPHQFIRDEGSSVSVYPIEVDPDQDNVLNVAISGHPEYPIDNCPTVFNPGQEDEDQNGIGDVCEPSSPR
ncbi:MAG: hypothetical protein IPJ69_02710 [Deltaproteobacteria bacterium]|nr:MAG: hypothetical protein IPJ69_02710 [Deltaproteobacteria bacterium]